MVTASSFLPARPQEKSSTSHLGRPHFSCFNLWLSSSRSSAHLLSQSTPGISLAEIPLPPTIQFCSCPSSRVPWGRGTGNPHCHLGPLCQKWFSARARGCPVSQLCPVTAQRRAGIPSSGRGQQAPSTKQHLHLLTAQLLKALLLPGLV